MKSFIQKLILFSFIARHVDDNFHSAGNYLKVRAVSVSSVK